MAEDVHLALFVGPSGLPDGLIEQLEGGFPEILIHVATSESQLLELLANYPLRLVVADAKTAPLSTEGLARLLAQLKSGARIVVLAEKADSRNVSTMMVRGAQDVVTLADMIHFQGVLARELEVLPRWREQNATLIDKLEDEDPVGFIAGENLVWSNSAFQKLLGLPPGPGAKQLWLHVDGDDQFVLKAAIRDCLAGKPMPSPVRVRIINALGKRQSVAIGLTLEHSGNRSAAKLVIKPGDAAPTGTATPAVGTTTVNVDMVKRVRAALDRGLLALAVQPISNLAGGGHEEHKLDVLVRLKDEQGELNAGEFLPDAGAAGLLKRIDHWVVHNACAMYAKHPQKRDLLLFLRLSRQSLQDPETVNVINDAVSTHRVPPRHLSFELTESELAALLPDELRRLVALKMVNGRLTVSQFGSRNESLSVLERLPLDFIKLDPKLTEQVAQSKPARERTAQIIAKAKARNIGTISTRVTDAVSLAELWKMGVNYVQGNYISEPEIVVQVASSL
jgi:EAL domain-containing protein (putative c-di-GMP-specific phosphodiesterase class I)